MISQHTPIIDEYSRVTGADKWLKNVKQAKRDNIVEWTPWDGGLFRPKQELRVVFLRQKSEVVQSVACPNLVVPLLGFLHLYIAFLFW